MRTRLAAIGDAVEERELAGVEQRREVVEVGVERGEAVPEANGVGLQGTWIVALAGGDVVEDGGIFGNANGGAKGVVTGILNGKDVIHSVIATAQEDEEEFLSADANVAFGEGALEEQREVDEGRQSGGHAGLRTGFDERATSNHVCHKTKWG